MSKYDDFYCESLGGKCINEGDCDNCVYGNEGGTEMEETKLFVYGLYEHCKTRNKCDARNDKCKRCFDLLGVYVTPNDVVYQLSLEKEDLIKKIHERRCK